MVKEEFKDVFFFPYMIPAGTHWLLHYDYRSSTTTTELQSTKDDHFLNFQSSLVVGYWHHFDLKWTRWSVHPHYKHKSIERLCTSSWLRYWGCQFLHILIPKTVAFAAVYTPSCTVTRSQEEVLFTDNTTSGELRSTALNYHCML